MYCILIAGIPAAGKSTMAKAVSEKLKLPVLSKDAIKELMFDHIGFSSREEKNKLGVASTEIMYYAAAQLMQAGQDFILENNFEYSSEQGIKTLLEKYQYPALTITLTGDYKVLYKRFLERENSKERHRGHVVNDCYPEKKEENQNRKKTAPISYEAYLCAIEQRGFDAFFAGDEFAGKEFAGGEFTKSKWIKVDTTDFAKIDMDGLFAQIAAWKEEKV